MEKINADLSPDGLLTEYFTDELTGKLIVRKRQDIEENIKYATSLRESDEYWRAGVKQGQAHVCHIPTSVMAEIYAKGGDPMRMNAREACAWLRKLGKEYLITTRKHV